MPMQIARKSAQAPFRTAFKQLVNASKTCTGAKGL